MLISFSPERFWQDGVDQRQIGQFAGRVHGGQRSLQFLHDVRHVAKSPGKTVGEKSR